MNLVMYMVPYSTSAALILFTGRCTTRHLAYRRCLSPRSEIQLGTDSSQSCNECCGNCCHHHHHHHYQLRNVSQLLMIFSGTTSCMQISTCTAPTHHEVVEIVATVRLLAASRPSASTIQSSTPWVMQREMVYNRRVHGAVVQHSWLQGRESLSSVEKRLSVTTLRAKSGQPEIPSPQSRCATVCAMLSNRRRARPA